MKWSAYLLRPMTGHVGRKLRLIAGGSWDITLNSIEEASVTVGKDELATVDRSWWEPWRGGILLTAESVFYRDEPILAGPIMSPPEETRDTAKFTVAGIRAMFLKRYLPGGDFEPGDERKLASTTLSYTGLSLGTIGYEIVKQGMNKTAGHLPIVHGSPYESGSQYNQRTYEGWNLANNLIDKRLGELSDVIGGPDIMFRPRWVDDSHSQIEWEMVHGTAIQPSIDQGWTMLLDTTSVESPVQDITVKSNAEHMTNKAYYTGAGEGAGTLIAIASDIRSRGDYMPLLETVGSENDSENIDLLRLKAAATVSVGRNPLVQVTLEIDGDSVGSPLGKWMVGDLAQVKLAGWLTIPDGTYDMRIIAAKGAPGSQYATVEFQEDVL